MSQRAEKAVHEWFYSGYNKHWKIKSCNVWYDKNIFYSYETAIAFIVPGRYGDVCLTNISYYSKTTREHQKSIQFGVPFETTFIGVAYCLDGDWRNIQAGNFQPMVNIIFDKALFLAERKANTAEIREELKMHINSLWKLRDNFNVALTEDDMLHLTAALEAKENLAAKRKARVKVTLPDELKKRIINETLDEFPELPEDVRANLTEKAHGTATSHDRFSMQQRRWHGYDLLLPTDVPGEWCTSRNVSTTIDVIKFCRMYLHGKLREHMRVGAYIAHNITDTSVSIGCHKFHRINIKALVRGAAPKYEDSIGEIYRYSEEEVQSIFSSTYVPKSKQNKILNIIKKRLSRAKNNYVKEANKQLATNEQD